MKKNTFEWVSVFQWKTYKMKLFWNETHKNFLFEGRKKIFLVSRLIQQQNTKKKYFEQKNIQTNYIIIIKEREFFHFFVFFLLPWVSHGCLSEAKFIIYIINILQKNISVEFPSGCYLIKKKKFFFMWQKFHSNFHTHTHTYRRKFKLLCLLHQKTTSSSSLSTRITTNYKDDCTRKYEEYNIISDYKRPVSCV